MNKMYSLMIGFVDILNTHIVYLYRNIKTINLIDVYFYFIFVISKKTKVT